MVGVEQWAEVRRLRFVRGLSIREIHRRTGLHRETIRNALNADQHTIKFGPPNRPGTIGRCNKNGNDLLCHFDKHDAGFSDGDTEGVVSGTIDGKPFEGSAWLKVIPVTKDKKD